MELLSKKISVGQITITIVIHDLSFRMGFGPEDKPTNHLFVTLTATDQLGAKVWTTPVLSENGKVRAYSTINEALEDAERRIISTKGAYNLEEPGSVLGQ